MWKRYEQWVDSEKACPEIFSPKLGSLAAQRGFQRKSTAEETGICKLKLPI